MRRSGELKETLENLCVQITVLQRAERQTTKLPRRQSVFAFSSPLFAAPGVLYEKKNRATRKAAPDSRGESRRMKSINTLILDVIRCWEVSSGIQDEEGSGEEEQERENF